MNKILGAVAVLIILFFMVDFPKAEKSVIPDEAIRFRVIANSNTPEDQLLKEKVRDEVQKTLSSWMIDVQNIEVARDIISNHLGDLDVVVRDALKENGSDYNYNVSFGMNYFPSKEYKGMTYPEGNYESLVITIGSGEGNNWWCVLFPPICLLEADESTTDVEYRFFVKDLIERYLGNNN